MSDLILFSLNAIVVYLLSDWILRAIERKRGTVIKQRQIVFFVIFLALALLSFSATPSRVSTGPPTITSSNGMPPGYGALTTDWTA
ncbi:MAG: hypothetical protein EXR85_04605 [Xanthomonadales bacterium]|nr:hypothetical protein [Xanthomonadales bacterium]